MNPPNPSMSLTKPEAFDLTLKQKLSTAIGLIGLFILVLATCNVNFPNKPLFLAISLIMISAGVVLFANDLYLGKLEGIKNDGVMFKSISSRGLWAWISGVAFTGFYVLLYFKADWLGLAAKGEENTGIVALFDPLSHYSMAVRPASGLFTVRFTP